MRVALCDSQEGLRPLRLAEEPLYSLWTFLCGPTPSGLSKVKAISFVSRIELYNFVCWDSFAWDVSLERVLFYTLSLLRDKSCCVRSSFVSSTTISVSETPLKDWRWFNFVLLIRKRKVSEFVVYWPCSKKKEIVVTGSTQQKIIGNNSELLRSAFLKLSWVKIATDLTCKLHCVVQF